MLMIHDSWENQLLNEINEGVFGSTGTRYFWFVEVKGKYRFHFDAKVVSDDAPAGRWSHLITDHIDQLLFLLKRPDTRDVQVSIQTPFRKNQSYALKKLLKICEGYDTRGCHFYAMHCDDGSSYTMPSEIEGDISKQVQVWP
ncbi:hypothetical protein [Noviherbaspirillum sp.]|uniref:hypothetical protein n=1 Tax=Noviherbaspirillum sp. TaxID=1926288 RepID=UPI002FE0B557